MTCESRIQDTAETEALLHELGVAHQLLALEVGAERNLEGWTPVGHGRLTVRYHRKRTESSVVETRTYELTDGRGGLELLSRAEALQALEGHRAEVVGRRVTA